jgi:hypothetical protein
MPASGGSTKAGVMRNRRSMAMVPQAMASPSAPFPSPPPQIQAKAKADAKKEAHASATTVSRMPFPAAKPAPAPMNAPPARSSPPRPKIEAEVAASRESELPPSSAHLTKLAGLARELAAQANGSADVTALRRLRERLVEWLEDVRSVGSSARFAAAVERVVQRLSAALALGTGLAAEAGAVATELARLASGPAPAPTHGRVAFWK